MTRRGIVSGVDVPAANDGRIVGRDSFQPNMSFEPAKLPAVPAPKDARARTTQRTPRRIAERAADADTFCVI